MATANSSGNKTCGLCLSIAERFPRSHLYPAWMGREMQGDFASLIAAPTTAEGRPGIVHAHGEYDYIVCEDCEGSFGPADDYFARFFAYAKEVQPNHDEDISWFEYRDVEPILLQRFFLTCLFRSHLSTRPTYKGTNLGPHAERIRRVLLSEPVLSNEFPVVLTRETHRYANAIATPARWRNEGVNAYSIRVPGFTGIVKVDKQPFRGVWADLSIRRTDVVAVNITVVPDALKKGLLSATTQHGPAIHKMAAALRKGHQRGSVGKSL